MANFSPAAAYVLVRQAGGSIAESAFLASVMRAESGGDPLAVNHLASCGTENGQTLYATGLFQVCPYSNRNPGQLTDPKVNAVESLKILRTQGEGAWTGARNDADYNTAKKAELLKPADQKSLLDTVGGSLTGSNIPVIGGIIEGASNLGNDVATIGKIWDVIKFIPKLVAWLTVGHNWVRIVEGVMGIVVIFIGLAQLGNPQVTGAIKKAPGLVMKGTE